MMLFAFFITDVIFECRVAYAQTYYVRADANGTADGSNWTNAYTALPAALTRGATYYIGDGIYPAYTFDDAESGTLLITIKKATATDHGTKIGWSPSFGDGQAQFPKWDITRNYLVIDGNVGSTDQVISYGFRITPSNCAQENTGVLIVAPNSSFIMTALTIKHTAVIMCGAANNLRQIGLDAKPTGSGGAIANTFLFANNYFVGGSVNLRFINIEDSIVENNYFGPNWSSATNHGGQFVANAAGGATDNIIVRNNIFEGSQVFVLDFHRDSNSNWKVYNNFVLGGNVVGIYSTGDSSSSDVVKRMQIHNNTHKNVVCSGFISIVNPGTLTNPSADKSLAYNNLQYNNSNCTFPTTVSSTVAHDYNAWFDHQTTVSGGDAASEANGQIASGNPFQSAPNEYRLRFQTYPGIVLPSPYEYDFYGNKRGTVTGWSRGAAEFMLLKDAPSFPPTNLKVF